jgi:O-antigen ligase
MGAIVALTKALTKEGWVRIVWAAIYVIIAIGVTIPASRGAFFAVAAGSAILIWRAVIRSTKSAKQVFIVICVLVSLYAFASETLTERLSSMVGGGDAELKTEKEESRVVLFNLALQALPEYWTLGIGVGNYWDQWSRANGFSKRLWDGSEITVGPHNGFFAVWIYFGLPGLALLCLICLTAGRRSPPRSDKSWDALSLTGLLVLGLFWLVFTHDLYLKQFGIILGLVMARDGARLPVPVNVRKTFTRHLRHQATRPRRIGKATIPIATAALPEPNRITGSNA